MKIIGVVLQRIVCFIRSSTTANKPYRDRLAALAKNSRERVYPSSLLASLFVKVYQSNSNLFTLVLVPHLVRNRNTEPSIFAIAETVRRQRVPILSPGVPLCKKATHYA